jgi:membrane protein implicated in regulation of membrane protease activity
MEPYLAWIVAGFVLVIIELLSGTFYLLVIGIGAFAGAAVAWAGGGYFAQAVGACAVALAGTWLVNRWHRARAAARRTISSTSARAWSWSRGSTRHRERPG